MRRLFTGRKAKNFKIPAGRIAMPPGYVKITYGRADRGDGGAVFINHKENAG
jgi:hypothetical protein